jgi:hypothetical protein
MILKSFLLYTMSYMCGISSAPVGTNQYTPAYNDYNVRMGICIGKWKSTPPSSEPVVSYENEQEVS